MGTFISDPWKPVGHPQKIPPVSTLQWARSAMAVVVCAAGERLDVKFSKPGDVTKIPTQLVLEIVTF